MKVIKLKNTKKAEDTQTSSAFYIDSINFRFNNKYID